MARAVAAVVLVLAVCCLLVAPAPARRPADLPPRAGLPAVVDVDREAAAEPLRPKPTAGADCGEAADEQGTALAVPEEDLARGDEEEPRQRTSLLCLVFRCGGEPAHAGGALLARGSSSDEPAAVDEQVRPAVPEKAEAEDDDERPYETDSDSDWDSDSDDEDDGGFFGWLWSLADRF